MIQVEADLFFKTATVVILLISSALGFIAGRYSK